MNQQTGTSGYEGTDYVCPNCGCEIMVKHSGDHSKMSADSTYTCRCGTRMQLEHAKAGTTSGL
ncbi:MAG TPA: hypothetical protein VF013_11150 [Candidatus Limnocylindria bacterium]